MKKTCLLAWALGAAISASAAAPDIYEWTRPDHEGCFSRRIPHTAILGNGDVGVTSGGDEFGKSFIFSKGDFWGYRDFPVPIGTLSIRSVKEAERAGISVARGASAKASSSHGAFPPARVLLEEFDPPCEGWVSGIGNPQFLELDLGAKRSFDRIRILHASAGLSDRANDTDSFFLSVRDDPKEEWRKIHETMGNTNATSEIVLPALVCARFLRLDVTKGTQETTGDSRKNPRARIVRIGLFDSALEATRGRADFAKRTSCFHETLDISASVIRTETEIDGTPVEMDTRLMEDGNLLVTRLVSKGSKPLPLRLGLVASGSNGWRAAAAAGEGFISVTRSMSRAKAEDPRSYDTEAALVTEVIGAPAEKTSAKERSAELLFTVAPGKPVTIVTAVGGGGRVRDHLGKALKPPALEEARSLVAKARAPGALAGMEKRREAWWRKFFAASSVELDPSDERLVEIQRYYDHSRWLLGSTLREGGTAAGLYGVWHTDDHPPWRSDFHLNYNFVASYYGLATMNHPELVLPAVDAVFDFLEPGASDAHAVVESFPKNRPHVKEFIDRKIAEGAIDREKGVPGGVLFPVGIGPWGVVCDLSYHNQIFDAAFSAVPFIQYWEATRDERFLKERLYPYLKPVLAFLKAWATEEPKGVLRIYAGYNEGSWAKNSIGELAMHRLCLGYAIMASEKLGVDAELRAVWKDMLARLAPYPTNEVKGKTVFAMCEEFWKDGEWRKWTDRPFRLTLEPIFPGFDAGWYSDPATLERWRDTFAEVDRANEWAGNNVFPELFTQAMMIRYDPERTVDMFCREIRRLRKANGTLDDGYHGVEKAGAIEAVHAMMVQSHRGVVKAFPAWLEGKSAKFRDLRIPGAFLASGEYDGAKRAVAAFSVKSEKGGPLAVAEPWPGAEVVDSRGRAVKCRRVPAPDHPEETTLAFETRPGETYVFRRR